MTTQTAPSVGEAPPPIARSSLVEQAGTGRTVLTTVRKIGFATLGLQFVVLAIWSVIRVDRFALTWDFSVYFQSWWLLGHGTLDPYSTVHGFSFWQNHGEFLLWPFALLGAVWPNPVTLLWLQAAGLVGAEAVAFAWMCDLLTQAQASGPASARSQAGFLSATSLSPALLALTGLVLLAVDPWVYWAVSFDFHFQLVGLFFLLLVARTLFKAPPGKALWLWVGLTLLCGDVVATYLAALGAGAALSGRAARRRGVLVAGVAVAWVLCLDAIHANRGSGLAGGYGYLAAGVGAAGAGAASPAQGDIVQIVRSIVQHPRHVLDVVTSRWVDVYAAVAPGGLLGAFSPGLWVAVIVVLLENSLNHYSLYLDPGFQNILIYLLVPVGTIQLLVNFGKRAPRLSFVLCALVGLNVVGWGAVWLPRLSTQWLRVSPGAASVLTSVERRIPISDEVVAWQGIAGPLSGRRWFYPVMGPGAFPVHTPTVWVVVAPAQGIELASVVVADAFIGELSGPLHARLVADRDGIWAFRWTPSAAQRRLVIPGHPTTIAAWPTSGAAGRPRTKGPPLDWQAVATGSPGYVVAEDYWPEPPAWYRVTVELSTSVPANVEVWNATGDVLLARRVVPPSSETQTVVLGVDATRRYRQTAYGGSGPFRIDPLLPALDNHLEIRVWTPGRATVNVHWLGMKRVQR
jgi:hypothetical protein